MSPRQRSTKILKCNELRREKGQVSLKVFDAIMKRKGKMVSLERVVPSKTIKNNTIGGMQKS
jgi:hypothetical protein